MPTFMFEMVGLVFSFIQIKFYLHFTYSCLPLLVYMQQSLCSRGHFGDFLQEHAGLSECFCVCVIMLLVAHVFIRLQPTKFEGEGDCFLMCANGL